MDSLRRKLFIVAGFLALSLSFVNLRLCLNNGVLADPFHSGEYFAALLSLIRQTSFVPLTIHGAMDYAPGLLSMFLFGKGHYFFATEMGYVLLAFLGAVFLFLLLLKFDLSGPQLIIAGFLIPWLVDYRDFSLIIPVWLYFLSVDQKPGARNFIFLLLLGLAGAFNFYWSANRGLAGAVSIGAALIILSFRDKRYLLPVGVFAAAVAALSFVHPVLALDHYLENLFILAKTSYQWGYGLQRDPVILSIYMALMLTGASALIVHQAAGGKTTKTTASACLMVFLLVFYYQISTYRADFFHIPMGLMACLIGISYWQSIRLKPDRGPAKFECAILWTLTALTVLVSIFFDQRYGIFLVAFLLMLIFQRAASGRNSRPVLLLILAVFYLAVGFGVGQHAVRGAYKWVSHIFTPPPNAALATKPMQWVSGRLIQSKTGCVFDMTNNGIINALADLPACSRFSYIVYADGKFENELIRCLDKTRPTAVVYSTTFWSYSIDGRPMRLRFPDLDRRIRERYPYEKCEYGYCLRYLYPPHE